MATQYIKYAKSAEKSCFPNYRGGYGLFWTGGGYVHADNHFFGVFLLKKTTNYHLNMLFLYISNYRCTHD